MAVLVSINRSSGGIPKLPTLEGEIDATGVVGDGHDHEKHRVPEQAISLLDLELLESIERDFEHALAPGSLGENLTVSGVGVQRLGAGDRLLVGNEDPVILEITRVRPPCYVLDAIDERFKRTLWNRIGMYARVIRGGVVRPNDPIDIETPNDVTRPLLRSPKPGCEDGRETARAVLAAHGLVDLPSESGA